jgi:leucyl aminopeptidase
VATLHLTGKSAATVVADALVLAVATGDDGPHLLDAPGLPAGMRRRLGHVMPGLGVSGRVDEVVRVPGGDDIAAPVVALTGMGEVHGRPDPETLRRAAGAALRELAGTRRVAVALPVPDDQLLAAVCEGALFGAYAFGRYRRESATPRTVPVAQISVLTDRGRSSGARAVAGRARVLADAVSVARDLVNTPPVDLHPAAFADAAVTAARAIDISVTVLDEKKLARGGYGGLLGVGLGSSRPPRLVRMDYSPAQADRHLALVGKGITFDSGGLSIKPAAGMEAMKSDMSGAAAVMASVVAIARLRLPLRVTGWLALAENMPSGTAQRPSDVITIRGGRTVEVLNTDAEGRLVLADAIVAAGETEPDLIVDVATLTGAQMVALGNRMSAIMSNDDALRERIHRVSLEVGEMFWPMPLPPELRSSMDSPVADIANMGDRYGGMLVAGLFLSEFVPRRQGAPAPVPWAHLDIAGPAFTTKAHGYTPVGGTGVSVRTLVGLAEDLAGTRG